MDNNQALHEAILNDDMETFMELLHQGVDLNYKNDDETPLARSLIKTDLSMAKCLIEAGCDVNLKAMWGDTPLYEAILRSQHHFENSFIELLIQRGADINAQIEYNGETSLHLAVSNGNLEITSMLLYYGANVNVTNNIDETSIMQASDYGVGSLLLNYYDDFSCRRAYDGHTALHMAAKVESPLLIDLAERGADVNVIDEYGNCLLYYTIHNQHAKLFKFIWSKIDHQLLIGMAPPFLLSYLQQCYYPISEFFECFYLILNSPIAHFLMQECKVYFEHDNSMYYTDMNILLEKAVNEEPKNRLSIIYSYLSLGAKIKIDDLQYAYQHYGFNEEFKALLYAGNLSCDDYVKKVSYCIGPNLDFYKQGFGSLSDERKSWFLMCLRSAFFRQKLREAWNDINEFPSLFELSRNKAQYFIQQNFKVTKIYQYYDVVECLKLPQLIKDVILLKKPIYL